LLDRERRVSRDRHDDGQTDKDGGREPADHRRDRQTPKS
jgi:hypothetical protein